jgi:hypothetical protein
MQPWPGNLHQAAHPTQALETKKSRDKARADRMAKVVVLLSRELVAFLHKPLQFYYI